MAKTSRLPSRDHAPGNDEGRAAARRRAQSKTRSRDEVESARERELDEALADTFPASDPVASISRTSAGAPRSRRT